MSWRAGPDINRILPLVLESLKKCFWIPAVAYGADSSKYLNNFAKRKRKENPFSLKIWVPYRADPLKNRGQKISSYCIFKCPTDCYFRIFICLIVLLFTHLYHYPFYSAYLPISQFQLLYPFSVQQSARLLAPMSVSASGTVLDLVSQIRDVVLVRRTFSSGKPQGVGILE